MSISEKLITIAENEQRVYEKGKQDEYDVFWDSYQVNGTRTGYNGAFGNERWTDTIFKPKYDFLGVKNAMQMFSYAQITKIQKTVEIIGSAQYLFSSSFINTISLLRVTENVNVSTWFSGCKYLITVNWDGVIGSNLDMSACVNLSKASILSTFSCLSSTASGMTLTLSKTAVNNAFETSSGTADGSTSEEWLNLVATKPNWTISLS